MKLPRPKTKPINIKEFIKSAKKMQKIFKEERGLKITSEGVKYVVSSRLPNCSLPIRLY